MQQSQIASNQIVIQCPKLNVAKFMCIQSYCQICSFSCFKQQCQQCYQNHTKCKIVNLQYVLQSITNKKQQIKPQILSAIKALLKTYDDSIQRLSKDKQYISGQISMLGYAPAEVQFMTLINDGLFYQINGKLSSKVIQELPIKKQWLASQQFISKYWLKKEIVFNSIFNRLKDMINMNLPILNSKVTNQIDKIIQFFGDDCPIYEFSLLYRASQNRFSADAFHKICDGVKNTLVLVKTQFGRIIGGFTPLPWNQTGNYVEENIYEKGVKSFLFSITNNEKYQCLQEIYAVCGSNGAGPTFGGGHDLYISDNANTLENGSYFNFPTSYNNGKYTNNQQSYFSFSGINNGDFYAKVFQWQVFKVQFKSL